MFCVNGNLMRFNYKKNHFQARFFRDAEFPDCNYDTLSSVNQLKTQFRDQFKNLLFCFNFFFKTYRFPLVKCWLMSLLVWLVWLGWCYMLLTLFLYMLAMTRVCLGSHFRHHVLNRVVVHVLFPVDDAVDVDVINFHND